VITAADPLDVVLVRLGDSVKRTGDGKYQAKCAAHEDRTPSLSVSRGEGGKVVMYCHAKCTINAICAAIGLKPSDLFPPREQRSHNGNGRHHAANGSRRIAQTYDYVSRQGELLFQVCRTEPKGFYQRRPDGHGGWVNGLGDTPRVLYRLPDVLDGASDQFVFVVEGEKDADRLAGAGLVATTNPMGAGKWRDEYNEALRGRNVAVVPDNDEPGEQHAREVAQSLAGIAASVRIVHLPDLPPKGDASYWMDAGGTADRLARLAIDAPPWKRSTSPPV
jgi:putative DNA primase/helicase